MLQNTSGNIYTDMANCLVGNATLYPKSCSRTWTGSPICPPDSPVEVVVELYSNNSWELKFSQMPHVYEYLFVHTVFSAYHRISLFFLAEKPILVIQNIAGTAWGQWKRQKGIWVKPIFGFWLATLKLCALGSHLTF